MIKEKEIIDWFIMVCQGIRQEYEAGVSNRSLSKDVKTLKQLLKMEEIG